MENSMNRVDILPKEGNLYKVNLHVHSTLSDGRFTPQELKEFYMTQGYHAVAFTDHRKCIPHNDLTDENFLALTGMELDFSLNDKYGNLFKAVHLNAISYDPEKEIVAKDGEQASELIKQGRPMEFPLINQTVAELKKEGFYVILNHPVWSNMSSDDVAQVQGFDAMEVFNSIAVMFNNYSDDSAVYQYFLRAGGKAAPIAADDCHRNFPDGTPSTEYAQAFVMVKAKELTYRAIMDAIKAGNFYASTGPMFENLWLEGDILHIECSPVSGVYVHSGSLVKKSTVSEKTDCITRMEVDISEIRTCSSHIWVQLRDTKGGKAWATPYWF